MAADSKPKLELVPAYLTALRLLGLIGKRLECSKGECRVLKDGNDCCQQCAIGGCGTPCAWVECVDCQWRRQKEVA